MNMKLADAHLIRIRCLFFFCRVVGYTSSFIPVCHVSDAFARLSHRHNSRFLNCSVQFSHLQSTACDISASNRTVWKRSLDRQYSTAPPPLYWSCATCFADGLEYFIYLFTWQLSNYKLLLLCTTARKIWNTDSGYATVTWLHAPTEVQFHARV